MMRARGGDSVCDFNRTDLGDGEKIMVRCCMRVGFGNLSEEADGMAVEEGGRGGGEQQGGRGCQCDAENGALRLVLVDVGQEREEVRAGRAQEEREGDGDEDADEGDERGEAGQLPRVQRGPHGEAARGGGRVDKLGLRHGSGRGGGGMGGGRGGGGQDGGWLWRAGVGRLARTDEAVDEVADGVADRQRGV